MARSAEGRSAAAGAGSLAGADAEPRRRFHIGKRVAPYLFLLPFMLLFAAFLVIPLVNALGLSVYKTTLVGGTRFVGMENFHKAFVDPKFWDGVVTLIKFGAMQIPVMLILALFFAMVLDSGTVYAKSFFRISFFIPYAVPTVVAALMWGFLYGPAYGPFAQLAGAMGWPAPDFLSHATILPSLANIAVWEYMGYNMIIYYAALQAVPQDLEEAAVLDGATALDYALRIKLPLIVPTIVITIVFSIIGTLQLFTEPYLMINLARSVIHSGFTPNLYAYTLAFTGQQYNYSAAISFLLGGVTAVLAYAFMLASDRRRGR
jgi:multiple sugar transport system permease protein